jgi:heme oxygenase (mycobilin-producing)
MFDFLILVFEKGHCICMVEKICCGMYDLNRGVNMKLFITHGTMDYLKKIKESYQNETMILMGTEDHALLLHETNGDSVFQEPRKYEVIDAFGSFEEVGFAVMNNIPVTEEGRPIFEYRFKQRSRSIEHQPGFCAIRVLRPITGDTYVILTLWKKEEYFQRWKQSKAFEKAHSKRGASAEAEQQTLIFPRPSYITAYPVLIHNME